MSSRRGREASQREREGDETFGGERKWQEESNFSDGYGDPEERDLLLFTLRDYHREQR